MKNIKNFDIKLSPTRKLSIDIYEHLGHLCLTVWYCIRLKDIPGYEDEWGTNWWKHFKLWKST